MPPTTMSMIHAHNSVKSPSTAYSASTLGAGNMCSLFLATTLAYASKAENEMNALQEDLEGENAD
jgi:hypothetical protein